MTVRARWAIGLPTGWWDYEEARLSRSRTNQTDAPENSTKRTVLLVDATGQPLIVREPRQVGFRIRETP